MKHRKLSALVFASGIFLNSCATYQHKPMSKEEWLWLGASALATAANIATTKMALDELPREEYWKNGILGKEPSLRLLISSGILTWGTQLVLGQIFPKYRKEIYQTYTALETYSAVWNTGLLMENAIRNRETSQQN